MSRARSEAQLKRVSAKARRKESRRSHNTSPRGSSRIEKKGEIKWRRRCRLSGKKLESVGERAGSSWPPLYCCCCCCCRRLRKWTKSCRGQFVPECSRRAANPPEVCSSGPRAFDPCARILPRLIASLRGSPYVRLCRLMMRLCTGLRDSIDPARLS